METRIESKVEREDLPLSFAQERLWFLDRMGAGGGNNIPLALRLRGPLDPERLQEALQAVVQRHEILRSGFPAVDGVARVVVADPCPVVLRQGDFRGLSEADRDTISLRIAREEAMQAIDFASPSLLRTRLLTFAEDDFVLLLTAPHIIWDRWSTGVLLEELSEIYAALVSGRVPELQEMPIQYADFAAWQRERFLENGMDRALDFWRGQVAGLPSLALPFDFPRPASQAMRSGVVDFAFPPEMVTGLRSLSGQSGASLAVVLLAAWKAYLARICRAEEVAVGVPFANRLPLEVAPLIGLFVNSLVMRAKLDDDPSFLDTWLPRVRDVSLEAYDHPEVPFEKLLEELEIERDASRNPLFQVLFSMQHQRREELRLGEVRISRVDATQEGEVELVQADTISSPMDLELRCIEHDGGLFGRMVYDSDLFEKESIEQMVGSLLTMMAGIVAQPKARLSELPLLTPTEAQEAIEEWNPDPAPELAQRSLHGAFVAMAQAHPQAPALIDPGSDCEHGARSEAQSWTFAELDAATDRVAAHLLQAGVSPGHRVGVSMPRSCWSVIGILAILKAGGVVVPLDPEAPAKRRDWIAENAELTLALDEAKLREFLETEVDLRALGSPAPAGPDDHATLLFTSGSTGRPKGVVGTHRGALRCIAWEQEIRPWQDGEVGCHQTKLDFVDAIHEIFMPLLVGKPVVLVREHVVQDPVALLQFLAKHQVSRITLVPSLLDALLDTMERRPVDLPHLHRWVSSGEALRARTARRFYTRFPEAELWNMYGSTETSAFATAYLVPLDEVLGSARPDVPIGMPLSSMNLYLLDDHQMPVPRGMVGEICIGGEGVARGYWRNEEMTAAKFLKDPYRKAEGTTLYRSGDLGRRRKDGVMEYLGREDHQVNVRGVRIELEEIGSCLEEMPEVQAAVASVWERGAGDQCLVAHVVLDKAAVSCPDLESTRADILEFARDLLPPFFRPARILFHEAIPRTSSGKVDRSALPLPDAGPQETPSEPPRPGLEQRIAEVWSEYLQVEAIDRNDLFIDSGGHSLLAVRVVAELEQRLGIQVPVADLIYRSLAQIAAAQSEGEEENLSEDPTHEPAPIPSSAPTPQKGSWLSRILKRPSS